MRCGQSPLPHKRRKILLLVCALAGCGLAAVPPSKQPALIWNYSSSIPVGLYRLTSPDWRRGDLVAVRPDPTAIQLLIEFAGFRADRLLLKRVTGGPGDLVCRAGTDISVNGVLAAHAIVQTARNGLPQWLGCQTLASDEAFLLGDHPASFDSRYFGPVSTSSIVGSISPFATFPLNGAAQR
jgi:conjugative transfer signal peptidase TraF